MLLQREKSFQFLARKFIWPWKIRNLDLYNLFFWNFEKRGLKTRLDMRKYLNDIRPSYSHGVSKVWNSVFTRA